MTQIDFLVTFLNQPLHHTVVSLLEGSYTLNSISHKPANFLLHLDSCLVFLYSKVELKLNVICITSHSEPIACQMEKPAIFYPFYLTSRKKYVERDIPSY